ncbi:hypothetical protein N9492_01190 [Flavobacteriaceae bacterium]|nr:hypothetical protein [Flavobacteriaceae bacterium]
MSPKKIFQLQEKYMIGLYFGFYTFKKNDFENIDFYIGEDNVVEIPQSKTPRLNLNGYNFQPKSFFVKNGLKKQFDFIFIGDPSRRKRLSMLIDSLNSALDKCSFSVLIINRTKTKSLYSKFLNKIVRASLGKMNYNKRSHITYLEVDQSNNALIPRDVIPFFIESAKCLIIPSLAEGAARVVAESLAKGLNVISFKDMQGATNNHLHKDYDLLFNTEKDLTDKICYYVENYKNIFSKKNIDFEDIFLEDNSKHKLKIFLQNTFKNFHLDKKNFKNKRLVNSLQSHNTFLPRFLPSNKKTDECISFDSMYKLICYLTENPIKKHSIFLYRISMRIHEIKSFSKQLITKIIN